MSTALTPTAPLEQHRTGERLLQLVDRPLVLLLLLLAVNAVTRPYANLEHDAGLYSGQVLNRAENGIYQDDLFFRHGSQDRFSLFSRLLAPVVKLLGLRLTFFLVYLLANTLFIAALIRLVRRLVEDRLLALLSLLYLVIAPLNYGGRSIFHVHEPFLTARLPAEGLVLLGIDYILQARYLPSLLLMVLAGLLHPLMATGGFLTWAGVFLVDRVGWRRACLVVGGFALAGTAILAVPAVATRLLGPMDDAWREAILLATSFNFPSQWQASDWANVLFGGIVLVAGVCLFHKLDLRRSRFCAVVFLLEIAAVGGTVLAACLPYALPLQGQPYRALWIVRVLQVPLCFLLADRLWRSGKVPQQILALSVVGLLVMTSSLLAACFLALFLLPLAMVYCRGLKHEPRQADWVIRSVVGSVVLAQLAWGIYAESLCLQHRDEILRHWDAFGLLRLLILNFGVLPWMALFLGLLFWLARLAAGERTLGLTCLGLFLVVQLFFFLGPNTTYAREHDSGDLADILYTRSFLRQQPPQPGRLPTIYSPYGKVEYVWLELQANSYFDVLQTAGFMFGRQTALEGQRRARLIRPFEVKHLRELRFVPEVRFVSNQRNKEAALQQALDVAIDAEPTLADLAQLCREQELDYAILKQEFPGLYSASNGRVFIYDCRQVRELKRNGASRPVRPDGLRRSASTR